MSDHSLYKLFELSTVIDGIKQVTITIHIGREVFAGQCIVTNLDLPSAMLSAVYVMEDQRKIGLCRRMFDRASEIAKEHGCRSIGLFTYRTNTDAVIAYCKLGLRAVFDYRDGQTLYVKEL